jgi:hypothetical protein
MHNNVLLEPLSEDYHVDIYTAYFITSFISLARRYGEFSSQIKMRLDMSLLLTGMKA